MLPAFNVVDLAMVRGVASAAAAAGRPVIIQLSSRTVRHYGAAPIAAAVRAAAAAHGARIHLHLDHCSSEVVLEEVIRAEFDGIMVDGSHMDYEANVAFTREWAHQAHESGMFAEGELGAIGGEEEGVVAGLAERRVAIPQLREFVRRTSVDLVGTNIGTVHGPYSEPPSIDFEFVAEIVRSVGAGFVVHGGSGLGPDILGELQRVGVAKINFSTDLKHSWLSAYREALCGQSDSEPLATVKLAESAVARTAAEKLDALSSD